MEIPNLNDALGDNEEGETSVSMEIPNLNDVSGNNEKAKTPVIGMEFGNLDDVEKFWQAYAFVIGFSTRIEKRTKSKKDKETIVSGRYVCNKFGLRKDDKRTAGKEIKHRWEIKSDCPVHVNVVLDKATGKYKLNKFISDHNHELETSATMHMLPDNRKVSEASAACIKIATEAGIAPKPVFDLMCVEAGGISKVGHLYEDQKTFLRTQRGKRIADCEFESIVKYFEIKKKTNFRFLHSEQYDCERWVTNIFWADDGMLVDYATFGDVVIFDTTFGTNKETRPFGVFAGLNHHREIVIFGAALLYDETIELFKWLFTTFVEAHGDKMPKLMFTDGDLAMAAAIPLILPRTHHALCVFHLSNNAVGNLGNTMDGETGTSLVASFKKFMFNYDEETEFENEWKELVERNDHAWLHRQYAVKEKWGHCFMRKKFSLGIRSTQICESINSDIKSYVTRKLSMNDFFKHFDRMVATKRDKELKSDVDARRKVPTLGNNLSPILQQVASRYTPIIFKRFHEEYDHVTVLKVKYRDETKSVREYVVVVANSNPNPKEFQVLYDPIFNVITCSCNLFVVEGYLCSHCLKVYNICDVMEIPKQYILDRWTRGIRTRPEMNEIQSEFRLDRNDWLKRIQSDFLRTTYEASMHDVTRDLVEKMIRNLSIEVFDYSSQKKVPLDNELERNVKEKMQEMNA